ncbi:Metallo-dependent hydrolase [Annulohypoxylon maeteangense]|uniref:Metallo-dependent hydrolase n=1 Tax=Annulohypoxylon maeteangense TaxID=1927788 RepID=UPI002008DE86|nr:Metallo-dependent hydrolase [Annulohypoxylon maeteangense]KAI0888359.1 Metallo-dependent hydrolase [Annulohypoxylon maeteangense]
MGTFCSSIFKDGDDGQQEKAVDEPPRKQFRLSHLRHLFGKMTGNSNRKTARRPSSKPGRGVEVDFHFQTAMMDHASPEEQAANDVVLQKRQTDDKLFSNVDEQEQAHSITDHFTRNVRIIEQTQLLKAARHMPKGAHLHLHFNSTLLPQFLLDIAKGMPNMYISSATHKLRSKSDFDNCEIVFTLQDYRKIAGMKENLSSDDEDPPWYSYYEDIFTADAIGPNLFDENYEPRGLMRYQYFRAEWNAQRQGRQYMQSNATGAHGLWAMDMDCDEWLISKLIFSRKEIDLIFNPVKKPSDQTLKPETEEEKEERQRKAEEAKWSKDIELEFHNSPYKDVRQRATRAWEKFNGRTRMMKGLFNYEKAFRAYTRKCLEEFVKENVQYAEIRPNFMKSNQVLRDNGAGSFNNFGLMEIIVEEYENFMKDIGDMDEDGQIKENRMLDPQGKPIYSDNSDIPLGNDHTPSLGGMKVIYCTPRSFPKPMVKEALSECILMKKRWPQYIAGFDLVGEEAYDKRYPLRYFEEEFRQFQEDCRTEQVDIPFLFHCGETPDDIEGNLQCALDLDAKRIGHGYALPGKPEIMEQMKAKNVCVEACPISNMVLGLVEHMDEHRIYDLLAHEVHCSLNSDNGTLFESTLSHDFYEFMVGNRNMNLYGWRQLARWSIDHSCMSVVERERILVEWERRWREEFIPELLGKQSAQRPTRFDRLSKIEENRQIRVAEHKL